MGLSAKIDSTGAIRKFRKMRLRSDDVLQALGERTLKEINKNFKTEGDTFAGGWEPLAPLTQRLRREGGKSKFGNKILRDTGKMAGALTTRIAGREAWIGIPGDQGAIAAYHNYGVNKWIYPVRAKALRLSDKKNFTRGQNREGQGSLFFKKLHGVPKRQIIPASNHMKPILVKMLRLWWKRNIRK